MFRKFQVDHTEPQKKEQNKMKIVLVHDNIPLQMGVKQNISPEHEVVVFSAVDGNLLGELVKKTKETLVIIQWGLLREGTGNFVMSLKRHEEFKIWVVSGGFAGDDDPIALEMLRAGADKAMCSFDLLRHLKEAGLTKS